MTKEKIYITTETTTQAGFNFKPGFVALFEGNNLAAATSGWESSGALFVYRPAGNGEWVGNWEWEDTFPVIEALEAIQNWMDSEELEKAKAYAEGKKLFLSENDIVFTDVVPGTKCNNGGEYGFYTIYSPIPNYPGIYRVETETTCNFDACGTGYQGIRALTTQEYRRLIRASDKIKAEGSLY